MKPSHSHIGLFNPGTTAVQFTQAAAPALELVGRILGDVEDAVDAGFFQRVGVRPWIAAEAAATASRFGSRVSRLP